VNGDTGSGIGDHDNTPAAWGSRYNDGSGFLKCCGVTIGGVANTKITEDPRALNIALRDPASTNGAFLKNSSSSPQLTVNFHRIHATTNGKTNVGSNAGAATALCQKVDATEGIGCLVEFPTDECSVGFAGLDASDKIFAERVALNGVDPTLTTIQALIAGGTTYPLARKLYINSLIGFGNLGESTDSHTGALNTYAPGASPTAVNGQYNLAKCFYSDYANASPSVTAKGFIQLPAVGGRPAGKPFCQNACGDTACGTDTDKTAQFDGIFSR
jgi:hypothetical protein